MASIVAWSSEMSTSSRVEAVSNGGLDWMLRSCCVGGEGVVGCVEGRCCWLIIANWVRRGTLEVPAAVAFVYNFLSLLHAWEPPGCSVPW